MIEWMKDKNGALAAVDAQTKTPVGAITHLVDGRDGLTVERTVEVFKLLTQEDSMYLAQAQEHIPKTEDSQ